MHLATAKMSAMGSKRKTLVPGAGRPSLLPKQQQQHALPAGAAGLQSAMDYYLTPGLTTMQITSPFQHSTAVQNAMERIVYENILNQTDIAHVLGAFQTAECVQAVARDLGAEQEWYKLGKLHHEYVRGFLIAACLDYVLEPLRTVIPQISATDWFGFTEPPGGLIYKPQLEKYKSSYNVAAANKLNARVRELLDNGLLLLMWFSSTYAVLQEELESKFHERDIMRNVELEIINLRDEKVRLEQEYERDRAEIVEAERRKIELQEMNKKSSEKSEQVGKVLAAQQSQIGEAQETLRQLTLHFERAQRKQRDIEMLVVKNPAELQDNLRSAQEALKKSQASKLHKQHEIMETKRNVEALANYASDLQRATTLADKAFSSTSAENIRKQRYNIERDFNLLKTEFDSVCRSLDAALLHEDVLKVDVTRRAEQDRQLIDEMMPECTEQKVLVLTQQTRLNELCTDTQTRAAMIEQVDDRIRREEVVTRKLECKIRDELHALRAELEKIHIELARRNGLE